MEYPDISLEESLWQKGISLVAGLDEVGRGPWAGPVVAGAVMLINKRQCIDGIRDSKKLPKSKRLVFYDEIIKVSEGYGLGIVSEEEIDNVGIAIAVKRAMELALVDLERRLSRKVQYLIIDGENVRSPKSYDCVKINFGDSLHYSIAASSVIAKVTRDRLMEEYAEDYPEYGFESNSGYGTKKHRDALNNYGVCKIHRKKYKPIARIINESSEIQKANWKYW